MLRHVREQNGGNRPGVEAKETVDRLDAEGHLVTEVLERDSADQQRQHSRYHEAAEEQQREESLVAHIKRTHFLFLGDWLMPVDGLGSYFSST